MDRHRETFRDEAGEILNEFEAALLDLENSPGDGEAVGRIFRALHTIKGSGAMCGFDRVAAFAHEVETAFELVRGGRLPVTNELITLSLAARDRLRSLVEDDNEAAADETLSLIESFRRFCAVAGENGDVGKPENSFTPSGALKTYHIDFRPSVDIFQRGINPASLFNELSQLGPCRITTHPEGVPLLEQIDPERCHLWWEIVLTTDRGVDAIRDVFIFVEDDSDIRIESLGQEVLCGAGEDLRQEEGAEAGETPSGRERVSTESVASVRVRSEKLDSLVDLIGELVTVQAQLSQVASTRNDPEVDSISEEVERLTWELRDQVLGIRMLPIGSTFSRFGRLVRDLREELGKDVELTTEGAETELDKTVIERLSDPLMHLIRNCVDHGIESPERRAAAGKPRRGRLHLAARHSGAHVIVEVSDDGAGIDANKVRKRAVAMGIVEGENDLKEKDLYGLIFHSGLSTAATVNSVSGRGVGMDVVKQAVEGLRGSIEVSSRHGEGTTFTLKLPLTLAIIDGLLVRIGGGFFVIPLSAVEECIELHRQEAKEGQKRNLIDVRGDILPYIRLREHFAVAGRSPTIEQIVLAEVDGQRVGFVVDEVIGEHQTVIKSLGRMYRDVKGLSGATILGDGGIALIVDPPQLVKNEEDLTCQIGSE